MMPRIMGVKVPPTHTVPVDVVVTCETFLRERWTLRVTPTVAKRLQSMEPSEVDVSELMDSPGVTYITVENEDTWDEHDRETESIEVGDGR